MSELHHIEGRLARIETKLDQLIETKADQEKRIRALERRDAYVLGASTALSLVGSLLSKKLFGI